MYNKNIRICTLLGVLVSLSSCNSNSGGNNNLETSTKSNLGVASQAYFPAVKCLIHGGAGYLRLDVPSDIAKDTSTQLKAELICLDHVKFDVTKSGTWGEKDDSIAKVSKTGIMTTHKEGNTKIVYFDRLLNHSVMADVHVNHAEVKELSISSGSINYVAGELAKLQVYASFTDGEKGRYIDSSLIKWTSSNNNVANVDKEGSLHLNTAGNAIIYAEYKNKTSQLSVTVEQSPIKEIHISTKDLALDALITNEVQINAEATLGNKEHLDLDNNLLECSSSNPKLLKFSESQNCLLEVVDHKKTGSAEIMVKYKNFTDKQTIKVTTDNISDIKAELNTDGLLPNTSREYKIYAIHKSILGKETVYNVTNNLDITSSDDSIISVQNNAIHTHKAGHATLSTEFGEGKDAKSYSMPIIVGTIDVQAPDDMHSGSDATVKVRTIDAKNIAHDVTAQAVITSSNNSVLSVINNKLIAQNEGEAKLKVSLPSGEFVEKGIKVTPALIKSIEISDLPDTIRVGDTKELHLQATYSDNKTSQVSDKEHVNWSISPADIMSISSNGVITPKQVGVAKVNVDYKGYKATASINIDAAEVTGMDIDQKELDLVGLIGDSKQISAALTYSDGGRETLDNDKLKCTTSNSSIAKISGECNITAVNPGNAIVTVTYDKYTHNVPVKVGTGQISSLILNVDTDNLLEDQARPYKIDATINGNKYDVTNSLVVNSSNPNVLRVDSANNRLISEIQGQSTISIIYGGKTYASKVVTVSRGISKISIQLVDINTLKEVAWTNLMPHKKYNIKTTCSWNKYAKTDYGCPVDLKVTFGSGSIEKDSVTNVIYFTPLLAGDFVISNPLTNLNQNGNTAAIRNPDYETNAGSFSQPFKLMNISDEFAGTNYNMRDPKDTDARQHTKSIAMNNEALEKQGRYNIINALTARGEGTTSYAIRWYEVSLSQAGNRPLPIVYPIYTNGKKYLCYTGNSGIWKKDNKFSTAAFSATANSSSVIPTAKCVNLDNDNDVRIGSDWNVYHNSDSIRTCWNQNCK
ncbi:MAG: Ig-like domain-containing protein [Burkholderiales bacterium]|nr:Ig-like domain-containing protein [Burkholderiales bacterium]